MQFMGQTYGQAHKQDQMIVGQSGNLQPKSHQIKQQFEQTARIPTVHQTALTNSPLKHRQLHRCNHRSIQQVTPEQAAQEIDSTTTTPTAPPN